MSESSHEFKRSPENEPGYITIEPDYANCEYRAWSATLDQLNERWGNDFRARSAFSDKLLDIVKDALYVDHRGTRIEFRPKQFRFGGLFDRDTRKKEEMAFLRKCHLNMIATAISKVLEEEGIGGCTPHIFDYEGSERKEYILGDL
jgi:hypothetical protein